MNDPKDTMLRAPAEARRAFPHPNLHPASDYAGMTLRDYFAAEAMHVGAEEIRARRIHYKVSDPNVSVDEIAEFAYALADEMLKARDA